MRQAAVVWLGVVLSLFVGDVLGAPTGVLHDPPIGRMGEAVPLTAKVEGVPDAEPTVTCWFRPKGIGVYSSLTMRSVGDSSYTGTLPADATASLDVKYYIVIEDPLGTYKSRIGSQERPITLYLLEPLPMSDPTSTRPYRVAVSGSISVLFIAGLWRLRRRSKRLQTLDRLFWRRTLDPLLRRQGHGTSRHVQRLSGLFLDHPTHGRQRYSKGQILSKLKEVRSLDGSKLKADKDEYLGQSFELCVTPVSGALAIDEVAKRVEHVSHEVAVLSTAAWMLSSAHQGRTGHSDQFLEGFGEARTVVQRAQDAVREHNDQLAEELCEKLLVGWRELTQPVDYIDSLCSADELARYLGESKALTAEMLGRLLEYYGKLAERNDVTRRKFLLVALALAASDGASIADPISIRQVFARRHLLTSDPSAGISSVIISHAASIRARMTSPNLDSSRLQGIRGELEGLEESLGHGLYTINGLSEIVSLLLAVDVARTRVEQIEARNLDLLIEDLEWQQEGGASVESVAEPDADDDPAALAMLRASAIELERALAEDNLPKYGFYMEHFEAKAIRMFAAKQALGRVEKQIHELQAQGPVELPAGLIAQRQSLIESTNAGEKLYGSQWIQLLTKTVICRRTMDWQARAQATGSDKGIPQSVATTLVRRATQLESDLSGRIQRDRVHGMTPRAELGSRFLNRFSRSRVGFALITDMQAVELSMVA